MRPVARLLRGAVLVVCATIAWPVSAQTSDELATLTKEIRELRELQESLQRDVQEIKRLVQERPEPSVEAPREVTVTVGGAPFRGDPDAPVTVVEFSDYQCPFCSRHVHETWPELAEYVQLGKVKHVFRDYPIESLHPQAFKAHEAAHCAGDQDEYWEMHATLFANQTALDASELVGHAEELGLDVETFRQCLDDGDHAEAVRAGIAEGETLGISATPTFLIGRTDPESDTLAAVQALVGAKPLIEFEAAIDGLLENQD